MNILGFTLSVGRFKPKAEPTERPIVGSASPFDYAQGRLEPSYETLGALLTALVAFGIALPASAQTAVDTRMRDQLRQTTTQLRALEDENASLKAQLAQRPAAPPPEAAPVPKVDDGELRVLRAKLEQESARAEALQQKLDTVEPILARWKQSYEEVVTLAKTRDGDAKRYETGYEQTYNARQACIADNVALVKISSELLTRYQEKDVWQTLRAREPLIGISKIKYEKLAQDYRNRIIDATAPPAAGETAP